MAGGDTTVPLGGAAPAPGAPALAALTAELREALAPGLILQEKLGEGGMGLVFLARDPALKRLVVVKVLAPWLAEDERARARFAREAESAAAVAHPNVISIFQVGALPRSRTTYFVMPFVEGLTLGEAHPRGQRVPEARVRRIVGAVASGLAAAHARGVVHRDIKPANVMLERDTDRVVVLDFGISAARAREPEGPADTRLTQAGTSLGTPEYMSPEQAAAEEVTERSDVYSLGVVAFELLAGRALFDASTAMGYAAAHIKDVPPSLAVLREDLDPGLADLVHRMLAKDPARRPAAADVARALLPTAHAVIEWPPPGLEQLRGRLELGLRWLEAAMLAALVTLAMTGTRAGASATWFLAFSAGAFLTMVLVMVATAAVGASDMVMRWSRLSGYPLRVAVDVGLDRSDATGAILNRAGTFALLAPDVPGRLMARRRIGAGLLMGGITLTGLLVGAAAAGVVALGDDPAAYTGRELFLLFLPALLASLTRWGLRWPEARLRRRRPEGSALRLRRRPPLAPELVDSWLAAAGMQRPAAVASWRLLLILNLVEAPWVIAVLLVVAAVAGGVMGMIAGPQGDDPGARRAWEARWPAARAAAPGWPAVDSALRAAALPGSAVPDTGAARAVFTSRDAAADPGRVWAAFRSLPSRLSDSLRTALAGDTMGPALVAFRRVAAGGDLPPLWHVPAGALTEARVGRAASEFAPFSRYAVQNAAAAALALDRGDKATAVRRTREVLAVGRQLRNDPLEGVRRNGEAVLELGTRLLREIGVATSDRALYREAERLDRVRQGRGDLEAMLEPGRLAPLFVEPGSSLARGIVEDRRLSPAERWGAIQALASGACRNGRELRMGAAAARYAALDEAARLAADIPRTADWVALQRARLAEFDRAGDVPWWTRWQRPIMRAMRC